MFICTENTQLITLYTRSKYSLVEPDPLLDATQKSSDSKLTISSELLVTEFNISLYGVWKIIASRVS